mmetsp:Transcript_31040/g.59934  ORF Transcript_31040/g.59934 Transcript_31040/m.59934 type:complete len:224 (-) Transcript_31040:288-959(-)
MRQHHVSGGAAVVRLGHQRVVGLLQQKLRQPHHLVAVLDGLHRAPYLQAGHGGVRLQLNHALVCVQARLVVLVRLGVLPCLESYVPSFLHLHCGFHFILHSCVALVDVLLHHLERRVIRREVLNHLVLVVRGTPQLPGGVVRVAGHKRAHRAALRVRLKARARPVLRRLPRHDLIHLDLRPLLASLHLRSLFFKIRRLRGCGLLLPKSLVIAVELSLLKPAKN